MIWLFLIGAIWFSCAVVSLWLHYDIDRFFGAHCYYCSHLIHRRACPHTWPVREEDGMITNVRCQCRHQWR